MKRIYLLFAILAMHIVCASAAKQVYTSFDESTGTLTYYYDDQMYSRAQTEVYDQSKPDACRFKDYNDKVQKAVIDVSMKSAELSSCKNLFYGCEDEASKAHPLSALISIEGLDNLSTADVQDMSYMFNSCESLKELNLSSFNTFNVKNMESMFHGCLSLEKVDLSSFNTVNVTSMRGMFYYCEKLTSLDLRGFDMSAVKEADNMFYNCSELTTIYCNYNWSTCTDLKISTSMFEGCNKLTGGLGTTLANYLDILDQCQLVCGLQKYACDEARKYNSSPKYQVFNNALMTANTRGKFETIRSDSEKWGRWVESAIGAHLLSAAEENDYKVFYWRERDDEVDYIVVTDEGCVAFEVKSGRRKMNSGIKEFTKSFKPQHSYIIGTGGVNFEDFLQTDVTKWLF